MFAKILCLIATITVLFCICSYAQESRPVSDVCLGCICEITSGCNSTHGCDADHACGPFGITFGFWSDAGKPTVNDESSDDEDAYYRCWSDLQCSSLAVQGYMARYSQDCTGNGVIDCDDYMRIHRLGAYGCTGVLKNSYNTKYKLCMQTFAVYNQ